MASYFDVCFAYPDDADDAPLPERLRYCYILRENIELSGRACYTALYYIMYILGGDAGVFRRFSAR